jgi:hypothetical protein
VVISLLCRRATEEFSRGTHAVQQDIWVIERSGELSAMFHGLRLAVRKHNGFTRFLVLAGCGDRYPEAILSSGTERNVEAAKAAATRTAMRLEVVLSSRRAKRRQKDIGSRKLSGGVAIR